MSFINLYKEIINMINYIKHWIACVRNPHAKHEETIERLRKTNTELSLKVQRLTNMLVKSSPLGREADRLVITNHAVERYRQRMNVSKNMPDQTIRHIIYRGVVSHLTTLDKLVDGVYTINKNELAKVINNTVVTVYPRKD